MLKVDIAEKQFSTAGGEQLLAIRDLQFQTATDQLTCIVGPSGCGKTSTLRIILGLDRDYNGSVEFSAQQKDPSIKTNASSHAKAVTTKAVTTIAEARVAVVFQEPRLLPWRTVRQNVELCLEDRNPDDRQKGVLLELYKTLGLSDLLDFFPSELSLGLARRVAIARAFAMQPGLLVLDEPFVSLDEATAAGLRQMLIDLWELRPTTILMVTHNREEAAMLADNVLVFSHRPTCVLQNIAINTPRTERSSKAIAEIALTISQATQSGLTPEGTET